MTELGDLLVCHLLSEHADVDHWEERELYDHQEQPLSLLHQVEVWKAEVELVEGP